MGEILVPTRFQKLVISFLATTVVVVILAINAALFAGALAVIRLAAEYIAG